MSFNDFYLATTLSVIFSLFVEEYFGILSGGMIVPGILALHFTHPLTALIIVLLSFIIYGLVEFVLSRYVILFGRRKFAVMMLLSIFFKALFEMNASSLPMLMNSYRGLSAVAPALLASTYAKQGIRYTVPTTLAVSFVIYLIVNILF